MIDKCFIGGTKVDGRRHEWTWLFSRLPRWYHEYLKDSRDSQGTPANCSRPNCTKRKKDKHSKGPFCAKIYRATRTHLRWLNSSKELQKVAEITYFPIQQHFRSFKASLTLHATMTKLCIKLLSSLCYWMPPRQPYGISRCGPRKWHGEFRQLKKLLTTAHSHSQVLADPRFDAQF